LFIYHLYGDKKMLQPTPEETQAQIEKLRADLDRDFADFVPEKERLAVYLADWMLGEIVMAERFIGMETVLDVAEDWLAQRKAGLS
jgi:hypothetical protein